jgi:hypothetical protein
VNNCDNNMAHPSQEFSVASSGFGFNDNNTHALRNPHLSQQQPRTLTSKELTDTQQISRSTKAAAKKENHAKAIGAYDVLLEGYHTKLEELAKAHSLDPQYLKKLHAGNAHFKPKRDVNIANAKIHMKAKEVNDSEYTFYTS